MTKNKRVVQAEETLKELEEPYKLGDLAGGFLTILIGCKILEGVMNQDNE